MNAIKAYLLTAAMLFEGLIAVHVIGRAEFVYGECHCIEKTAGIVLAGSYAFLIGNAIFGSTYKILSGADYPYHREDSEAYKQESLAIFIAKASVKSRSNELGNVSATTARAAGRTAYLLIHSCGKHNGVNNLHNCLGHVLCATRGLGKATEVICAGRASEYADIAFAAVKDDLLFNNRNTLKFLRSSGAHTSLKDKLDVESDVHSIKSAIETHGIDIDMCQRYSRFFCANVARSVDDIVSHIGKINTNILKAIPVAAGIENSVCLYANGVLAVRSAAKKSVFSAI